jgi:hypothetical protein
MSMQNRFFQRKITERNLYLHDKFQECNRKNLLKAFVFCLLFQFIAPELAIMCMTSAIITYCIISRDNLQRRNQQMRLLGIDDSQVSVSIDPTFKRNIC